MKDTNFLASLWNLLLDRELPICRLFANVGNFILLYFAQLAIGQIAIWHNYQLAKLQFDLIAL